MRFDLESFQSFINIEYALVGMAGVILYLLYYVYTKDNDYNKNIRSLATYKPAFAEIAVNPIRDVMDPTPLETLKHEAVHLEQDINPDSIEADEAEAHEKMKERTARQERFMDRREAPQNIPDLEDDE